MGSRLGWARDRVAAAESVFPTHGRCPAPPGPHAQPCLPTKTYFVTLKIRNNLRARNTLIPKDVPGFMTAQMTSKMLPMITWNTGSALVSGSPCKRTVRLHLAGTQPNSHPPMQAGGQPRTPLIPSLSLFIKS